VTRFRPLFGAKLKICIDAPEGNDLWVGFHLCACAVAANQLSDERGRYVPEDIRSRSYAASGWAASQNPQPLRMPSRSGLVHQRREKARATVLTPRREAILFLWPNRGRNHAKGWVALPSEKEDGAN
jgi:hypothetical protein